MIKPVGIRVGIIYWIIIGCNSREASPAEQRPLLQRILGIYSRTVSLEAIYIRGHPLHICIRVKVDRIHAYHAEYIVLAGIVVIAHANDGIARLGAVEIYLEIDGALILALYTAGIDLRRHTAAAERS